jgi:galactoside 2-L-fucosyltransferase 1/2
MQYLKTRHKDILFVVESNDIDWSKKALAKEKNVYFSTGNSPAEDMALLSLANHTIKPVGTFGWWIGWMAQGTSIFYENIFRPKSTGTCF